MKLQVFGILILLGLFHVIRTVPTSTGSRYGSQAKYIAVLQNLIESYIQREEGKPSERYEDEIQNYLEEQGGDQSTIREEKFEDLVGSESESKIQEGEGRQSESYKEEIQKYFEEYGKDQTAITVESNDDLYQGDTIAIQSHDRSVWLGCGSSYCAGSTCSGVYFSGSDWQNCNGEVFQIYRKNGQGQVVVGDHVGMYYPHQSGHWLGCDGQSNRCVKASCPGSPTTAHGFATQDDWDKCWGEVFQIYANGKSSGDVINSGDDIMLYYDHGNDWVYLGSGYATKGTCPGSSRPPGNSKYDRCWYNLFRIQKK